MKKAVAHVSLILCIVLLAGCSAARIHTDHNPDINFQQFHTYSWGDVQTTNPLWVPRIKQAVNNALASKGWQEVPSGGQVTVMAVGSTHDRHEYQTFYNTLGGGGWGWRGGWGPGWNTTMATTTVNKIRVGTLVVDLYQTSDRQLIWRGSSSDSLSDNVERNVRQLDQNVAKMFREFPPKPTRG